MPESVQPEQSETSFDVDAWITDARPPQRAVVVYGRGDLLSRLQALEADIKANPDDSPRMGGDPRRSEMRRLREQIDASRRVFHVRALLEEEREEIGQRHTTKAPPGDPDAEDKFDAKGYEHEGFARAITEPVMTVEQVKRLHAAIGEAQWLALAEAIGRAGMEPVDVPLSQLDSEGTPT